MQLLTNRQINVIDKALEDDCQGFQEFTCSDQECANRMEEIDDLIEKWLRDDNDDYDEVFDCLEEIIEESEDSSVTSKAEGLAQELRWHIQKTVGWNGVPESHEECLTNIQKKTIEANSGVRLSDWSEHIIESAYSYLEEIGWSDVRSWTSEHLEDNRNPSEEDLKLEQARINYFNNLVRKLWKFDAPCDYEGWDFDEDGKEEGDKLLISINEFLKELQDFDCQID